MSVPTQQKALFLQTKQGEWAVVTTEVDKPGPGEILIRIESTALNPVDWMIQATGFFVNEYPAILGSDAAGVVVQLGEGVTSFAIGDKVLHQGYFTNRLATFKQYTIVPAEIAAKIPSNITPDQAASVPLGLATAALGLYNKKWDRGGAELYPPGKDSGQGKDGGAELYPPWKEGGRGKYAGQPIVIWGGSGSVGQYGLQLARLSGFSPIITLVSPHSTELVKSLGATHAIDRSLPPAKVLEEIKAITSEPIKIVYDAIAKAESQNVLYDALAPGGKLVVVLNPSVDESKLTPDKEIIWVYGTVHLENNRECGKGLYAKLTELLESGDIKPNAVEVIPNGLGGIPAGLERLKKLKVSGYKLIARPQETA